MTIRYGSSDRFSYRHEAQTDLEAPLSDEEIERNLGGERFSFAQPLFMYSVFSSLHSGDLRWALTSSVRAQ
jgi:hypothetical protein